MLTPKRDLRTGTPIWALSRKPGVRHAALERRERADVVVVGAGISGALVAESLTQEGLSVVLVDRRSPLAGSTSASTALLQHELDTPLTELSRSLGRTQAESVWRRSRLVVSALAERTQRLGISADLVPRDALYLAGNRLNTRELALEAAARRAIGLEVELLGQRELRARYGISRQGALLGCGNFVADPRKLAAGYLRVAIERGARLFAPVEVTDVRESRAGVTLQTRQGIQLRGKHVVFATGYEVLSDLHDTRHSIQSTWVIATKPQRRALWPTECMIWEASDPYLYLRTTTDGRVVCGGGDEPFADAESRDALSPRKHASLERSLGRLFPHLDASAAFAWAGSFGTSKSGTPIIGRAPGKQRTYAVLGCGGNGITFSVLAAQIVTSGILGRTDRDAPLFAPGGRHKKSH